MIADYKRDLQNNYLIFEVPEAENENRYEMLMAEKNEIHGLLPFHSVKQDGKWFLYYDITGKQSVRETYEKRGLNYSEIIVLFRGIYDVAEIMQKYLLNASQLVYMPEYLYITPEQGRLFFCYLPGEHEASIEKLAEFILMKLDHEDPKAVALGYRFYQNLMVPNFSLHKILKELLAEETGSVMENRADTTSVFHEDVITTKRASAHSAEEECWDPSSDHVFSTNKTNENIFGAFADEIFRRVHPGIIFSLLLYIIILEILFYFELVRILEFGGLFFLGLSIEVFLNRLLRKKKIKQQKDSLWDEEEEELLYQKLQDEVYRNCEEEEIEETRCLVSTDDEGLYLSYRKTNNSDNVMPDIVLRGEPIIIGKKTGEADVILNCPTVSRIHAKVDYVYGEYYIWDLDSKNGTYVNGVRMLPQKPQKIKAGDYIFFAQIQYQVLKQ